MNLPCVCYFLLFSPALVASTRYLLQLHHNKNRCLETGYLTHAGLFVRGHHSYSQSARRGYEDLESKLKQISMEKSSLLHQLSKSATDLQGMKSLKTEEAAAKNDVQKLLDISQKQKDEMKSLQEALQKQINEAALKAEKQQAGINFLKAEVERKSKLIKDLQQENKSLKNKLLSGNKQCGIHAEESKRIQSQLKELRYGKKDLIFKAQQLTDLERKLLAAKQELEKTEGDKGSQLKALKEVARLCVSGVLKNQPPFMSIAPPRTTESGILLTKNSSRFPSYQPSRKLLDVSQTENTNLQNKGPDPTEAIKSNNQDLMDCSLHKAGKNCSTNQDNNPPTE
ncbi:leucine zipper protein 2 isoform X1 [Mobula hypostoma]|uniref:leucine zipper protein 2 isoform X1 n=1 Tax=Mobula hypostoma TaxID=723540 RepID=UPI002FC37CB7